MNFDWILKRPIRLGLVLTLAAGLGGLAAAAVGREEANNPPAAMRFANPDEPPVHNTFAPVVKRVLPAVVNISSSKMVKTPAMDMQGMDPIFRQFFGDQFNGNGR